MSQNLLPGENIFDSIVPGLMVSTHRVRLEIESSERVQITSIMLDQLCSCETRYVSRPVLLIIAGICVLLSLFIQRFSKELLILGLMAAVVLVLIYFNTRYSAVSLASAKAEINVKLSASNAETIRHLIDQIENAKNARYLRLQAIAAPLGQEPAGNRIVENAPAPEMPQQAAVFHCSKCGVALTEREVYRHRSGIYCEKHYEKAIAG